MCESVLFRIKISETIVELTGARKIFVAAKDNHPRLETFTVAAGNVYSLSEGEILAFVDAMNYETLKNKFGDKAEVPKFSMEQVNAYSQDSTLIGKLFATDILRYLVFTTVNDELDKFDSNYPGAKAAVLLLAGVETTDESVVDVGASVNGGSVKVDPEKITCYQEQDVQKVCAAYNTYKTTVGGGGIPVTPPVSR